jgi:hypothetical membrane protein
LISVQRHENLCPEMSEPHPNPSLESLCLLAAAATPILHFVTQMAAAPFYPGYSFSQQSASMLGTQFSRYPWIFNAGEVITGLAALGAAWGLYRFFRRKTNLLLSWLVGISVAVSGVMYIVAGTFPMPDPRHNAWGVLHNFTIITPYLMLIALWKRSYSSGLRTYLMLDVAFLFLLGPLAARIGRGTFQQLIAAGTIIPLGVVGLFFWRDLHGRAQTSRKQGSDPSKSR